MLEQNWKEEFGQLGSSCIALLSEQAELAYRQGSVVRLKSCVKFLLKHQACEDVYLTYLAEAGLKAQKPLLAELGLRSLLERMPNHDEYRLHLAEVLSTLCRFDEAIALLEPLSLAFKQDLNYQPSISAIEQKAQQQVEISSLATEILAGAIGQDLTDKEYTSHTETLLQAALDLCDYTAVIYILSVVSKRVHLPKELLIELLLEVNKFEQLSNMRELINSVGACADFPELLRFYLDWMLTRNKPIAKPLDLLAMMAPFKKESKYSDIFCILYGVAGLWREFATLCDKAILISNRPAALLRYLTKYRVTNSLHRELDGLYQCRHNYSANELRFFATGLEGESTYQQKRIELLQQANNQQNSNPFVLNDLGDALIIAGNTVEACQCFYQAMNLDDEENFFTCYNLAVTLRSEGDNPKAFEYFKKALAIDPEQRIIWQMLGQQLVDAGSWPLAYELARYSLVDDENNLNLWVSLSSAARQISLLAESRRYLEHVFSIEPDHFLGLINLTLLETACGNIKESEISNYKILNNKNNATSTQAAALSSLLFSGNYNPELDAEQLFKLYQRVNEFLPKAIYEPSVADYSNRKIKVGYVSADFKRHPVAFFLEALLKYHNKEEFEVFAYSCVEIEDVYTELLKESVDHWRYIARTSDQAVAEQIQDDGIDVLIDLSGHTRGGRLAVFALRPCAVQISWLGFAQTTGLNEMDYFLGDAQLTPAEHDPYFSEQPYRLPRASYCYMPNLLWRFGEPNIQRRAPGAPIVFGNLGRAIRFNSKLLAIWQQLLVRIPNSIIKIDNPNFSDEESQEMMYQRFAEHGIARERVWVGYTPNYIDSMLAIDVALDGIPQNSGTTLFEFLWCGVPIVTLKDRPSVGRLGAMVLHGLGRDEWIAETAEQYIAIAAELASDPDKLFNIRKALRAEFIRSELCDGPGFAKAVEDAYRVMLEEKSQCQ